MKLDALSQNSCKTSQKAASSVGREKNLTSHPTNSAGQFGDGHPPRQSLITLLYLTLPPGWAGSYTCAALRLYNHLLLVLTSSENKNQHTQKKLNKTAQKCANCGKCIQTKGASIQAATAFTCPFKINLIKINKYYMPYL